MTNKKSISTETRETLEAACSALDYALDHAKALRRAEGKSSRVADALVQGLKATMSASSADATVGSLRGHVANSVTHLRASLKAMQDLKIDNAFLEPTLRATARSLALLYPLTQTEGPILLVPRKKRKSSRRKAPVVAGRAGKRPPVFEVAVGSETETNFFTGFEGDISSGGLFIATYDVHPIDTVLTVNAKLPGGRVVAEEATVRWVREYNEASPEVSPGMGVVFDDLSYDEHREIDYFMTKRDAIFYEAV
ncbi:MAG: TIGR02266 family protein [Deltaproteobacteria bacterium]|nr:TIGR02266 family protein [Deltaproteobacteria bacterium]